MWTQWNESETHYCGRNNEEWGDFKHKSIGLLRNHVFLGQELHAVSEILEETGQKPPDAVIGAILDTGDGLKFVIVASELIE